MNFPTSFDVFVNPAAADSMDSPTVYHDVQHANINDAVTALQAKIGIDGSAVTTSLDYKMAQVYPAFTGVGTLGYPTTCYLHFQEATPVTADAANYKFGLDLEMTDISISVGKTDSGERSGARISAYPQGGLVGTLTNLFGLRVAYGTYVSVPATGVITNAYGLHISPFCFAGTVTNLYGIYIRQPYTGGTCVNEWGIYQVSTTAQNFFGGITTFASGFIGNGACNLTFTPPPSTVSGTNYIFALNAICGDIPISSGVTDSGGRWGARFITQADAGLVGTLEGLYGVQITFGNYTSVPATGTINNAYGLYLTPFCFAGTITNLYGIYIRQPYTGGTLTNEWGIYQVSTTAKNFFGGLTIFESGVWGDLVVGSVGHANVLVVDTVNGRVGVNRSPDAGFHLDVGGGPLAMRCTYSSYTPDGVWDADARPCMMYTPAAVLLMGYSDNGSGQYTPSLGFSAVASGYLGATLTIQNRVVAESYNRFQISHAGCLSWGPGSGAVDATLYRASAGLLQTSAVFKAAGYQSSDGSAGISDTKTLLVSVTIKNGLITAWS